MAGAVGLHPIVVLAAVIIGSKVAGVAGAIFGIPIAAVLSSIFLHYLEIFGNIATWPAARRSGWRTARVAPSGSRANLSRGSTPTSSRRAGGGVDRPPRRGPIVASVSGRPGSRGRRSGRAGR